MTDAPENILLESMRRFDARQARFADSLRDLSARLASIESYLATLQRDLARHGGEIEGAPGPDRAPPRSCGQRLSP